MSEDKPKRKAATLRERSTQIVSFLLQSKIAIAYGTSIADRIPDDELFL